MDLSVRHGAPDQIGFPRPRGDGPLIERRLYVRHRVSPPTRGWTRTKLGSVDNQDGFPAHAGMDPIPFVLRITRRGFPRPRGDGPHHGRIWWISWMVSPPTRGWTGLIRLRGRRLPGFPAHAGMDLTCPAAVASRLRFPRPRGDGPQKIGPSHLRFLVSPPTRGWTRGRTARGDRSHGFPAHAGMDPAAATPTWRCPRFPRPRGDGPLPRRTKWTKQKVSPPTRGWTRACNGHPGARQGFPAHAGMDRREHL